MSQDALGVQGRRVSISQPPATASAAFAHALGRAAAPHKPRAGAGQELQDPVGSPLVVVAQAVLTLSEARRACEAVGSAACGGFSFQASDAAPGGPMRVEFFKAEPALARRRRLPAATAAASGAWIGADSQRVLPVENDGGGTPQQEWHSYRNLGPAAVASRQEVWAAPLADGALAVLLVNRGEQAAVVTARWEDLGLPEAQEAAVRDLWEGRDVGVVTGSVHAAVRSHGVALLRVTPNNATAETSAAVER